MTIEVTSSVLSHLRFHPQVKKHWTACNTYNLTTILSVCTFFLDANSFAVRQPQELEDVEDVIQINGIPIDQLPHDHDNDDVFPNVPTNITLDPEYCLNKNGQPICGLIPYPYDCR